MMHFVNKSIQNMFRNYFATLIIIIQLAYPLFWHLNIGILKFPKVSENSCKIPKIHGENFPVENSQEFCNPNCKLTFRVPAMTQVTQIVNVNRKCFLFLL